MNAVCLVIDRLHAGYVGAYGNTWIETPALDRLASQSLLLDQALVDSPDLERLYRSYWQGWHALVPAAAGAAAVAGRPAARGRRDDGAVERRAAGRPAPAGRGLRGADRDRPALAAADRRGDRADALRPLLRRDDRVAAIGPRAVLAVVPPGRLGHDVGRAAASSARRIGSRAIRRRPSRPTCPTGCCRPTTTRTSCWASRRRTPAR